MSAAFVRALAFTLEHEGGYSNDPNDPGGETNFGISKRAHHDEDIKNLTREQAANIYRIEYWERAQCDLLPEPIAIAHFDCAVNSGVRRATMILQAAIGADVDGKLGLETLNALQVALRRKGNIGVAMGLVRTRAKFLIDLEQGQQRWIYLRGWMNRCLDLAGLVSQSAGASALPPQIEPTPP